MYGICCYEWTMCDIERDGMYCWVGVFLVVFTECCKFEYGYAYFSQGFSRGGLVGYDAPFTRVRYLVQLPALVFWLA